jgi:hypothetical protein
MWGAIVSLLSCGHKPSLHSDFTTGTATLTDGREVCWTCADTDIRRQIDATPIGEMIPVLYLTKSPAGTPVLSTWSGGTMLRVTSHTTAKVGFGFAPTRTYLRATDEHGTKFHGTSPGFEMSARVYKSKVQS